MTGTPPLPGEWIDFGPDVTLVAAHPLRLWVAVVRTVRDGTAMVEHHDLSTRAVLSVTEVPTPGDVLVWVGDRIALITFCADLTTSYVDVGVGCVDVVHIDKTVPNQSGAHVLRRFAWGVELGVFVDDIAKPAVRLRVGDRGIAVEVYAGEPPLGWHPDSACVVTEDRPPPPARGASLDIQKAGTTQRLALPGVSRNLELEILGFSSPDHFVLLRCSSPEELTGPSELWSVDWQRGLLVSLNDYLNARLAWLEGGLSLDGQRLAFITYDNDADDEATDTVLTVVDAHTGDLCACAPVSSFARSPTWLGVDAVVTIHTETDLLTVDVLVVSTSDRRRYRLDVRQPSEGAGAAYGSVQALGSVRVLYVARDGSGSCFVSDPLVPR